MTLRQPLIVSFVAILWATMFEINAWFFSSLEHTTRAHWIFLPAALRPLSILIFGRLGAWGLVLGAYITVYGSTNGQYLHEVVLSLLSGLLPWFAVARGRALFRIPDSLAGLRARHVVILCTMCAGANAIGLNAYLWMAGRLDGNVVQILAIFVGDVLGAAIILLLIPPALTLALRHASAR